MKNWYCYDFGFWEILSWQRNSLDIHEYIGKFNEVVQCSQYKEFTNFLKVFAKLKLFYDSLLFRCSLLLFKYDLSI